MAWFSVTQQKAEGILKDLADSGETAVGQAQKAFERIVERSKQGSEELRELVRSEIREQVAALGWPPRTTSPAWRPRSTPPRRRAGAEARPGAEPTASGAEARPPTVHRAGARRGAAGHAGPSSPRRPERAAPAAGRRDGQAGPGAHPSPGAPRHRGRPGAGGRRPRRQAGPDGGARRPPGDRGPAGPVRGPGRRQARRRPRPLRRRWSRAGGRSTPGSSTGGFTDCLLQRGAASVVAVDVGYGQLDLRLRQDPRVTVAERTNVRDLTPDRPRQADPFPLIVADLSFISLRTVAPALLGLAAPGADLVLLVKPQFEAGRAEASREQGRHPRPRGVGPGPARGRRRLRRGRRRPPRADGLAPAGGGGQRRVPRPPGGRRPGPPPIDRRPTSTGSWPRRPRRPRPGRPEWPPSSSSSTPAGPTPPSWPARRRRGWPSGATPRSCPTTTPPSSASPSSARPARTWPTGRPRRRPRRRRHRPAGGPPGRRPGRARPRRQPRPPRLPGRGRARRAARRPRALPGRRRTPSRSG